MDNRLVGVEHAWLECRSRAGAADMDHFRAVVEHAAQAMAAEIAHDAIAVLFRVPLNGMADVAQRVAGLRLLYAQHQAFIGDLDQAARLDRGFAANIHAAAVAVPAVDRTSTRPNSS